MMFTRRWPTGFNVHCQYQTTVTGPGKRGTGQSSPQPGDVDPSVVDPGVQGFVPAPTLGSVRQVHESTNRTVGAGSGAIPVPLEPIVHGSGMRQSSGNRLGRAYA